MVIRLAHLHCDHCDKKIWPPEMEPLATYYFCPNCGDILCEEAIELVTQDNSRFYKCKSCSETLIINTWPRPCE